MQNIVKLGDKQKHLKIPDGWFVVTSGKCVAGDRFANVGNPNKPFWQAAEEDDIDMESNTFDCLIRQEATDKYERVFNIVTNR